MTVKQKAFIQNYIENGGNGTQAAFNVYNCKNLNVAGVMAHENLRKPKVLELINLSLEPDEAILSSVVVSLRSALEEGNPREKLKAIEIYFRAIGVF